MLQSIRIQNYKALKDVDMMLSNFVLVSGLNNAGKSSLIQVLLLLRQSHEKKVLTSKGLLLKGDYVSVGKGMDALTKDAEEERFRFVLDWENGDSLEMEFGYDGASNLQPIEIVRPEDFDFSQALFSNRFKYLSAERTGPKSTYPVSEYDIEDLESLGINGEYTAHFLFAKGSRPLSIAKLKHENARSDELLAQLDAWMSEIAPGIRVTPNVIRDIDQASLHYQFETAAGYTEKFRPENVGFGLTYVLPVVTSILASKKGDLVIVENPEAHLHPAGQTAVAKLMALAAENGVQVIAETHSDHFLNGLRVAVAQGKIKPENTSLFYFAKKPEFGDYAVDVTNPFVDGDGRIDEWPAGFFDEWDVNLDKLLGQ